MTLTSLSFLPGENERVELVNSQGPFDPSWSPSQLGSLCCRRRRRGSFSWRFFPQQPLGQLRALDPAQDFHLSLLHAARNAEHLCLPAIPDATLESLRQRGCLLCLRSLKRTAGEPPVSASHPHRSFSTEGRTGCSSRPAVRSRRTLPGGHLGSVPSQRERQGAAKSAQPGEGRGGRGTWAHLSPPPSTLPAPACLCPPSGPDARYLLHPVPNQPQIIDCTWLCTPAYIYHPASRALRRLACTFSRPRSEGMEGEREGMSVPAPMPSPWLRRC